MARNCKLNHLLTKDSTAQDTATEGVDEVNRVGGESDEEVDE
jgi:hypothetical protein